MKAIALFAVVAILLLDIVGAVPRSSVGGPLTLMLIFLLAMLAAGLHEAWTNGRCVLGWLVSILAAMVGGFVVFSIAGMLMELVLPYLQLDGPLATSQHPMRYILPAGTMLLTLLGSWLALWVVNRFR